MTQPLLAAELQELWAAGWRHLGALRAPFGVAASETDTGLYPALFGRDALWVVLFLMELIRDDDRDDGVRSEVHAITEHVLVELAVRQASAASEAVEAQPGKVLHVHWPEQTPAQALGIPLENGTSYCGFDQTFLFVIAVARFLRLFPASTARPVIEPASARAVEWIRDEAINADTGLCAYQRRNVANPVHQVWKDSFDSITHAGFDVPASPVAWIEVQAYAYTALVEAGLESLAASIWNAANATMRDNGGESYWVAVDGTGMPVRMHTSNPAHALWAGAVGSSDARSIVDRLRQPDMLTDFGIRTLSSNDRFFEADSYHRGTIWPFDNAVAVAGMLRYGFVEEALDLASRVLRALQLIGSPTELYVVVPASAVVFPQPGETFPRQLLLHRRFPPQNIVQAFSVGAQLYSTWVVARDQDVALVPPAPM
jgi:glycogen debranching enzyme